METLNPTSSSDVAESGISASRGWLRKEWVSISPNPNAHELIGAANSGNEPQRASDLIESPRSIPSLHKLMYQNISCLNTLERCALRAPSLVRRRRRIGRDLFAIQRRGSSGGI
jgi:hypothetical protein